jgi:hypothetical protein
VQTLGEFCRTAELLVPPHPECLVLCSDTGIYDDLTRFSVKATIFVCPITHHVMTAYEGVEVQLHAFLSST